jgi:pyruvate/2-oxoglutarate dehydrogenase complex dihydrolipoamide acyltransferase (E2) component
MSNTQSHLVEVKVPQLSESVSEATLITWHKKVGDAVSEGENLIDVETDKVVLELPATKSGVLTKIIKADGSKVVSEERHANWRTNWMWMPVVWKVLVVMAWLPKKM